MSSSMSIKLTKDDLGKHLFETIKSIDEGKEKFSLRHMSVNDLRNFSKIDSLPMQKEKLLELFTIAPELHSKLIRFEYLSLKGEQLGIEKWSDIKYKEARTLYWVDKGGKESGNDIPHTRVTLIFEYASKEYSVTGFYIEDNNGYHLATIKYMEQAS